MSKVYTSADQLIGHTPLLELTHLEKKYNLEAKVIAKVEYFNPVSTFKVKISVDQCDSGWRFTLRRPEAPDTVRVIAYGSVLEIWEHEF